MAQQVELEQTKDSLSLYLWYQLDENKISRTGSEHLASGNWMEMKEIKISNEPFI